MIRISLQSEKSETSHEFFFFVKSEGAEHTPNENNYSNAEAYEYDCLRVARAEAHCACARVRPFSRRPPVSGWGKIKEEKKYPSRTVAAAAIASFKLLGTLHAALYKVANNTEDIRTTDDMDVIIWTCKTATEKTFLEEGG